MQCSGCYLPDEGPYGLPQTPIHGIQNAQHGGAQAFGGGVVDVIRGAWWIEWADKYVDRVGG